MYVTKEAIERVRSFQDLVRVIESRGVKLQRKGRNWVSLPKTPSGPAARKGLFSRGWIPCSAGPPGTVDFTISRSHILAKAARAHFIRVGSKSY